MGVNETDLENYRKTVTTMPYLSSLWCVGDQPTLNLPSELAEFFKLDKPCQIIIQGKPELDGVLIKYIGPPKKKKAGTP